MTRTHIYIPMQRPYLADGDGLLDEHVQVLGDLGGQHWKKKGCGRRGGWVRRLVVWGASGIRS